MEFIYQVLDKATDSSSTGYYWLFNGKSGNYIDGSFSKESMIEIDLERLQRLPNQLSLSIHFCDQIWPHPQSCNPPKQRSWHCDFRLVSVFCRWGNKIQWSRHFNIDQIVGAQKATPIWMNTLDEWL